VACYEDLRDLTVQEVVRSIRAGRMWVSERDAGRGYYCGMKAGKESDSQTVRSGISGAYRRKVKMFDDR
jgi:hypothetical protein